MDSPATKSEVLDAIRTTRQALEEQLAPLTAEQVTQPGVNGAWTVKDALAHITWWEQYMLRRLRTGHDELGYGGAVDPQAVTDRANAEVYAANHDRPLAEVRAAFDSSYQDVLALVEALPEEEFMREEVAVPIAANTYWHYPEHTEMLRAWKAAGRPRAE
jgi:hypothetical protein